MILSQIDIYPPYLNIVSFLQPSTLYIEILDTPELYAQISLINDI